MAKTFQIAIDGYTACGKSSVSRLLAKALGLVHVDTGTMYRAFAHFLISKNLPIDEDHVNLYINNFDLDYQYADHSAPRIVVEGQDVSKLLRTEHVSGGASRVGQYKKVRDKMVALQRKIASHTDVVMDGRDIGSIVLPDAQLKIFLFATKEKRTDRRWTELRDAGQRLTKAEVRAALDERDRRDVHRKESPLVQTTDAVPIDNTNLSLSETVAMIEVLAKMRKSTFIY